MSNIFDQMAANASGEGPEQGDSPAAESPAGDVLQNATSPLESNRAPAEVRKSVQELLRQGYIEESRKSEIFRQTIIHQEAINAALDPLDLVVKIDSHRGIALVGVRSEDDVDQLNAEEAWSHPLVRRQRLTLEQSLVIAILRGVFVLHEQESGVGHKPATMAVDDLLPQYLTYVEDSGSDARNETKLLGLLDQLKGYGIVSEVDAKQEFTIRPLIAHLANPESLSAMLQQLQELSEPAADQSADISAAQSESGQA